MDLLDLLPPEHVVVPLRAADLHEGVLHLARRLHETGVVKDLDAMEALNRRKAEKLYGFIDDSAFYNNPVQKSDRSWMNVPFVLADDALDKTFLEEAEAQRLLNLAGHRSVGGMRASIYNAVPEAAVDALIDFMKDFEKRNG